MNVQETRRNPWRRWLLRAMVALLALELAWLGAVNLALALPLTQSWLNGLRPEKVRVSWQSAWSWYPGRVSVEGAVVSGQTPRFQWQAEADRVRGSVALLPLLQRRVEVARGDVVNGRYRQRPRLAPEKDYGAALDWYPDIEGYPVAPEGTRPRSRKPPWTVTVDGARLSGRHAVWINRLQAELSGTARADLTVRSQGGPLELDIPSLDLALQRAWADADEEILSAGRLGGSYHLGPYGYRDHRGIQALRFMDADLEIGVQSRSLEFLELFLLNYPDLRTRGTGTASGRIVLRAGRVADGTDLRVDATDLSVSHEPFLATGNGTVTASHAAADLPFTVGFRFDGLEVRHLADEDLFFTGEDLAFTLEDSGDLVPRAREAAGDPRPYRASIDLPEALVPDMRTFNRYLPPTFPAQFAGGSADLAARMTLTPDDAGGTLHLRGQDLRATLDTQELELGLDLAFDGIVAGGRPAERFFDLSGSRLTLDRARVVGAESRLEEEDDWFAEADFRTVELVLARPVDLVLDADLGLSDTRPLTALFRNNGGPDWIARRLEVDDLSGSASVVLRGETLYVPETRLGGEVLEFAVRGVIGESATESAAYLRYRRLDVLLRMEDDDRDVILLQPREKYEAYRPPSPPEKPSPPR